MFPFRWSMVFFVLSINAMMMTNGDVFKGELDLILVVDSSGSINYQATTNNFDKIKESLKTLPDQFPIGPNQTRMAIIHFGDNAALELGLTDDAEKYKATISKMKYMDSGATYTGKAMEMTELEIRKSQSSRPNAPKAVILVTDGEPNDGPLAEQQAEIIRKQIGELLFIAYIEHSSTHSNVTRHMETMTGTKENMHQLDDFTKLTAALFSKISQQIVQQIVVVQQAKCPYTKVCQYKDQSRQQCVGEWVQQSLDDSAVDCSKYTKPATVLCDMTNCTALCDLWKWESVQCQNTTCGQNFTKKREGDPPGWKPKFDNCLQQEPISCPPCPVTIKQTETKKSDEKSGFPLWVIGLIIGVLLLILLVISIAVIMRRRRSRQAAADALKTKMAAAAAAPKAAQMTVAAKKSPKGSMMGASGYGMQFGGFGGKMSVDQSVAANLETGQTTLKPAGNFGRSRINKPSSSINVNHMKKMPKSMMKM